MISRHSKTGMDPDPFENVLDPEHCPLFGIKIYIFKVKNSEGPRYKLFVKENFSTGVKIWIRILHFLPCSISRSDIPPPPFCKKPIYSPRNLPYQQI